MLLLVDTGVLYALADRRDAWHRPVVNYLKASPRRLLAPVTILPEAAYLLRERIGADAELALTRSVRSGELAVESLQTSDWTRTESLMSKYGFLGLVDASIIAVAERLKLRTLATTDRRHFAAVQPSHVHAFSLVP